MLANMPKTIAARSANLVKMSVGFNESSWSRDTVWICGFVPLEKSAGAQQH